MLTAADAAEAKSLCRTPCCGPAAPARFSWRGRRGCGDVVGPRSVSFTSRESFRKLALATPRHGAVVNHSRKSLHGF